MMTGQLQFVVWAKQCSGPDTMDAVGIGVTHVVQVSASKE